MSPCPYRLKSSRLCLAAGTLLLLVPVFFLRAAPQKTPLPPQGVLRITLSPRSSVPRAILEIEGLGTWPLVRGVPRELPLPAGHTYLVRVHAEQAGKRLQIRRFLPIRPRETRYFSALLR